MELGAAIVVGDVARSPRMKMHAESLAKHSLAGAWLIGTASSRSLAIENARLKTIDEMQSFSGILLLAPIRMFILCLRLAWLLIWLRPFPSVMSVQCPPSPPALLACLLAKVVRLRFRALVVCDWHNFGENLLKLKVPGNKLGTMTAKAYAKAEEMCAKAVATTHLTVSASLKEELERQAFHNLRVARDRPPPLAKQTSAEEAHRLFFKISEELAPCGTAPTDSEWALATSVGEEMEEQTILTKKIGDEVIWRSERPKVIVSATSWTPDEDMFELLEALQKYDTNPKASPLLVVITGEYQLNYIAFFLFLNYFLFCRPSFEEAMIRRPRRWTDEGAV